jgi:hypothetical protein
MFKNGRYVIVQEYPRREQNARCLFSLRFLLLETFSLWYVLFGVCSSRLFNAYENRYSIQVMNQKLGRDDILHLAKPGDRIVLSVHPLLALHFVSILLWLRLTHNLHLPRRLDNLLCCHLSSSPRRRLRLRNQHRKFLHHLFPEHLPSFTFPSKDPMPPSPSASSTSPSSPTPSPVNLPSLLVAFFFGAVNLLRAILLPRSLLGDALCVSLLVWCRHRK